MLACHTPQHLWLIFCLTNVVTPGGLIKARQHILFYVSIYGITLFLSLCPDSHLTIVARTSSFTMLSDDHFIIYLCLTWGMRLLKVWKWSNASMLLWISWSGHSLTNIQFVCYWCFVLHAYICCWCPMLALAMCYDALIRHHFEWMFTRQAPLSAVGLNCKPWISLFG